MYRVIIIVEQTSTDHLLSSILNFITLGLPTMKEIHPRTQYHNDDHVKPC